MKCFLAITLFFQVSSRSFIEPLILTGSADYTAKLWRPSNAAPVVTQANHTSMVWRARISRDGQQVLTGSWDDTAKLYDATTGALLMTYEGHDDDVVGVDFNPDNSMIVTASDDHSVKLWDAANGTCLKTFGGHEDTMTNVLFSPCGNQIIVTSDHYIQVQNIHSGDRMYTIEGQADVGTLQGLALSHDGQQIQAGGSGGFINKQEFQSGTLVASWDKRTHESRMNGINGLKVDPSGLQIVQGSENYNAYMIRTEDGSQVQMFRGSWEEINDVSISKCGRFVATASSDDVVRLYERQTGIILKKWYDHRDEVTSIDIFSKV